MGILKKIFGGEKSEKPKYKAPDVKFMEDDDSVVTHTIPISVTPSKQKIVIKDGDDVMVFDSIDQVPEDIRETIEQLDDDASTHHSYSVIINGERKTYESIDDLPDEIRASLKEDGTAS